MPKQRCGAIHSLCRTNMDRLTRFFIVDAIAQLVNVFILKFALFSGATFRTGKEKGTVVSAGTVVKNCCDLLPIIKLLTAEHASELNLDAPVDLKKLKYYYVEHTGDNRCSSVHSDLNKCMKMYVHFLNIIITLMSHLFYGMFYHLSVKCQLISR